jgi:hypothetical protein
MREQVTQGLREYTERVAPPMQEAQQSRPPEQAHQQAQPVQNMQSSVSSSQTRESSTQAAQSPPQGMASIQIPITQHSAPPRVDGGGMAGGKVAEIQPRISREQDYKDHPYKYFTLREFILGVALGFVLGFVVSKLIFGSMN